MIDQRTAEGKFSVGHDGYWLGKTRVLSEATRSAMSAARVGRPTNIPKKYEGDHHGWKGDSVSYSGIHKYIKSKLGSPMICSECEFTSENPYKIHWANISGEYKRDLDDWARLCASCHKKHDLRRIKEKAS